MRFFQAPRFYYPESEKELLDLIAEKKEIPLPVGFRGCNPVEADFWKFTDGDYAGFMLSQLKLEIPA